MRRLLLTLLALAVLFTQGAAAVTSITAADTSERSTRQTAPSGTGIWFTVPASPTLPAPAAAVNIVTTTAEKSGINVARFVNGFDSSNRASTDLFLYLGAQNTRLLDSYRLASGHWPTRSEMATSNAFASTVAPTAPGQVGIIADVLANDTVEVRRLVDVVNVVPIAGTYFAECAPSACQAFLKNLAAAINDPAITPATLASSGNPNVLAGSSSGDLGTIAALVASVIISLLLLVYLQIAAAKRLGVMRMLGIGAFSRWALTIGRFLLIVLGVGILAAAIALAFVPGITVSVDVGAIVLIAVMSVTTLALSAVATAISGRIRLPDALKNKRPVGGLFILGAVIKVVAAATFIITIAGLINTLAVYSDQQQRLSAWTNVRDYGIFYPKSVGNDLVDLKSGQPGSTVAEVYDLYPAIDSAGGVFVDLTGLNSSPTTSPSYPAMRVNANYLAAKPVLATDGSVISVAPNETNWVVLVPDTYRSQEQVIRSYFETQRLGDATQQGAVQAEPLILGRPVPAALQHQQVDIRWVKSTQSVSTYSTAFPADGSGAIPIPIIEVMTQANSLGIDRANAFSGTIDNGMRVRLAGPGETAQTYQQLEPLLAKLHLADNLTNLVTPAEAITQQLASLQDGIRVTLLSTAIAFLLMILMGAQNTGLAFDRFRRNTAIKSWLGYTFVLRHRPTLIWLVATWAVQSLFALALIALKATPFGYADVGSPATALAVAAMLAIEIAVTVIALVLVERRSPLSALKGSE